MRSRRASPSLPQQRCWMATIADSRQLVSLGHRYFRRVGPTALSALSRVLLGIPEFSPHPDETLRPWRVRWPHLLPTFPVSPPLTAARTWPRIMGPVDTVVRNGATC